MEARLQVLEAENEKLRAHVTRLEREIGFLRTHPVFLQGLKGEKLIAKLTGGELTEFATGHDVTVDRNVTIEVKFSKLNTPNKKAASATRRWNWSNITGGLRQKSFDYLILIGEKDDRYPDQYLDDSPYIFFLVPGSRVHEISQKHGIRSNAQIGSNLAQAHSEIAMALKTFIVPEADISRFLKNAR